MEIENTLGIITLKIGKFMTENMIIILWISLVVSILFVVVLVGYISAKREIDRLRDELQSKAEEVGRIPLLEELVSTQKLDLEHMLESNDALRDENYHLNIQLTQNKDINERLKENLEEQSKRLGLELERIMDRAVESKIEKLDTHSMRNLAQILEPFRTNIDEFKAQVVRQQESSIERFASLSKEIEHISKMGLSIGTEAKNLTQALKGKKQMQGSWGEMILESVLEHSGLVRDRHYYTQSSYRDSEGKLKRPDVVIKLPQERTIIVDSKVSLVDYDRYIKADNPKEREQYAKAMVASFKAHIDTLSQKEYTEYDIGSLQYVFMFVPIESAFALAVQSDTELYEYALQKNIAVVNPSILTVSLKTIYLYWQSEHSNTLAIKLFHEAGALYDKMDLFAKSFSQIGRQLEKTNRIYETAHKRLTEGSGNLMGKVENLKALGARTKKNLKKSIKFDAVELDMDDIE